MSDPYVYLKVLMSTVRTLINHHIYNSHLTVAMQVFSFPEVSEMRVFFSLAFSTKSLTLEDFGFSPSSDSGAHAVNAREPISVPLIGYLKQEIIHCQKKKHRKRLIRPFSFSCLSVLSEGD